MKNILRLLALCCLGFFAWTCNTDSKGPDTISLTLSDSLKAFIEVGDSVVVTRYDIAGTNSADTIFQDTLFKGRYTSPTQLQNLTLPPPSLQNYMIVFDVFRGGQKILEREVIFTSGKAGAPRDVPLDTAHTANHPPLMWLGSPDSGITLFHLTESQTLSFRVLAHDTDAKDSASLLSLRNASSSSCGLVSYDTSSGNFSFKPSFACVDYGGDSSVFTLKFPSKDKGNPSLVDTLFIHVIVLDSNSAPKWKQDTLGGVQQGKEGMPMSLTLDSLYLGDAENDSVSFTASLGNITQQHPLLWSFTPSFSDSGTKTVQITATDNHKPPASSKLVLKLYIQDSTRLVDVVINSPPNGYVTRDSVIAVKWSVNNVVQTTQTLDTLKAGPNGVKRTFRDSLGNVGSDSITVTLDRTPPSQPTVLVPSLTNNPRPTWTWRSGGGGDGYFRHRLDTASFVDTVGTQDTSFTPNVDLNGSHVLYVEERDDAGNWSAMASGTVRVSVNKPVVIITSPPNNYVTRQSSVDVYWTVNTVAQTKVTKSLVEGTNVLTVVGQDSAGNKDSASVTVTRDTVPPIAPIVTGPSITNNQTPAWTWHSSDTSGNGYYRYKLDTSTLTDTVGVTDSFFTSATNLSEGTHTLFVQERDLAGNWSQSGRFSLRVDLTPPNAPKVSLNATTPSNNPKPIWNWISGGGGDLGTYRYKLDNANLSSGATTTDSLFYQPILNLAEGSHTLYVQERDSAGNWSASGNASLTIDLTPPNAPIFAASPLLRIPLIGSPDSGALDQGRSAATLALIPS